MLNKITEVSLAWDWKFYLDGQLFRTIKDVKTETVSNHENLKKSFLHFVFTIWRRMNKQIYGILFCEIVVQ